MDKQEIKQRLGLKKARLKRGLSQEIVASKVGISRTFYTQIESGERNCNLDTALKLSEYLGIDVRDW